MTVRAGLVLTAYLAACDGGGPVAPAAPHADGDTPSEVATAEVSDASSGEADAAADVTDVTETTSERSDGERGRDRAPCGGCAPKEVCFDGSCLPSGSPESYAFPDHVTFLDEAAFGGIGDEPPCCFDLDGDGELDNAATELWSTLSSERGGESNVNDRLEQFISGGTMRALLEARGLDPGRSSAFELRVLWGARSTDFDAVVEGVEGFEILPSSFVPGTALPRTRLDAVLDGEELRVDGGTFRIRMPAGERAVWLPIRDVRIEASAAPAETGDALTLEDAQLGGYLRLADFWASVNDVAERCDCLELGGEPFVDASDPRNPSCTPTAGAEACEPEDGPEYRRTCQQLAQYCEVATWIAPEFADIDADDDDTPDAISFGLRLHGIPLPVAGLAPPADAR